MGSRLPYRIAAWLGVLVIGLLAALGAYRVAAARAQAGFAQTTLADARLRQALLASEIARFRLLPLALADDRDLVAALARQPGAASRLDAKLADLAQRTGAAVIYVIDAGGMTVAASNWRTPHSFVGQDYRFRRYYRDARRDGAGEQFALGSVSGRPGLYLARRTAAGGVVVVKLAFDAVERQWRAAGGITFVTDAGGVILITSRADWRFAATRPVAPMRAAAIRDDSGVAALRPSPFRMTGAQRMAAVDTHGPLLRAVTAPDRAGWRVNLALPLRGPVDAVAQGAALAAALLAWALLAIGWAGWARARRRARHTQALEAAVAARTADLSREMAERARIEARAADLREGLRQANRLATLGQVTASVAHETAQPVAAIRNYAASGELLLDRGDTGAVRDNLHAIARLTDRIGAVTAQLRGFARKASGAIGPVALVEVIDGAQLILKERLSGIAIDWPVVPPDLMVIAGRVRLEQVIVNLLQNAAEALADREAPWIGVTLMIGDAQVALTIRDNGPGIAPDIAARLFTPFATSRAAGLGLGLVIAQDIMHDLGGNLRLAPTEAGAAFVVTMRRSA